MLKDALAAAMLIASAFSAAPGQDARPAWAIKFEDCLVADVFKGKPAAPILATKAQRMYRTVIREGAEKGPNFAGHYTVAEWGCGSACMSFAVVDAETGRVYDAPFADISMAQLDENGRFYRGAVYQLKSRLFIADGCPNEEDKQCGTHYYEWKDNKFVLLRFDPSPPGK